jgi:uncharacterized protein (DUF433 family)
MSTAIATLTVSRPTYDLLVQRARAAQRQPDDLADELLRADMQATSHPYIVRQAGVRGGRPILRGSSVPVWLIAAMWKAGDSPDEIAQAYPHLQPAALYDAISYYFDYRQEVEAEIAENRIARALSDSSGAMDARGVITFIETHA